ncbi:MAG: hypothetical protein KDB00_19095 [Planctomycetales bacterium]|nr:hypothetical protein [Planctomycetales bacterium]
MLNSLFCRPLPFSHGTFTLPTDLVIEEAGLELIGLAAEMDLLELAITGPAVIVDLQPAPPATTPSGPKTAPSTSKPPS